MVKQLGVDLLHLMSKSATWDYSGIWSGNLPDTLLHPTWTKFWKDYMSIWPGNASWFPTKNWKTKLWRQTSGLPVQPTASTTSKSSNNWMDGCSKSRQYLICLFICLFIDWDQSWSPHSVYKQKKLCALCPIVPSTGKGITRLNRQFPALFVK